MLTRPQPYEAEAKTHKAEAKTHEAEAKTHEAKAKTHKAEAKTHETEAKTHEAKAKTHGAKAEARFSASYLRPSSWGGRGLKNQKNNGSLVKTRRHVQQVRNWVNYRTKKSKTKQFLMQIEQSLVELHIPQYTLPNASTNK